MDKCLLMERATEFKLIFDFNWIICICEMYPSPLNKLFSRVANKFKGLPKRASKNVLNISSLFALLSSFNIIIIGAIVFYWDARWQKSLSDGFRCWF